MMGRWERIPGQRHDLNRCTLHGWGLKASEPREVSLVGFSDHVRLPASTGARRRKELPGGFPALGKEDTRAHPLSALIESPARGERVPLGRSARGASSPKTRSL